MSCGIGFIGVLNILEIGRANLRGWKSILQQIAESLPRGVHRELGDAGLVLLAMVVPQESAFLSQQTSLFQWSSDFVSRCLSVFNAIPENTRDLGAV
jgi:hypothetical protein